MPRPKPGPAFTDHKPIPTRRSYVDRKSLVNCIAMGALDTPNGAGKTHEIVARVLFKDKHADYWRDVYRVLNGGEEGIALALAFNLFRLRFPGWGLELVLPTAKDTQPESLILCYAKIWPAGGLEDKHSISKGITMQRALLAAMVAAA